MGKEDLTQHEIVVVTQAMAPVMRDHARRSRKVKTYSGKEVDLALVQERLCDAAGVPVPVVEHVRCAGRPWNRCNAVPSPAALNWLRQRQHRGDNRPWRCLKCAKQLNPPPRCAFPCCDAPAWAGRVGRRFRKYCRDHAKEGHRRSMGHENDKRGKPAERCCWPGGCEQFLGRALSTRVRKGFKSYCEEHRHLIRQEAGRRVGAAQARQAQQRARDKG